MVTINPGKLGLSIVFEEGSGAVVTGISDACTFRDEVQIGDLIVTIDGKEILNSDDLRVGNDRVRRLGISPMFDVGGGCTAPADDPGAGVESSDDDAHDLGSVAGGIKRKWDDDVEIAERWECGKCAYVNDPSKARCSKCQGWKGGKRDDIRKKNEKKRKKKAGVFDDDDDSFSSSDDEDGFNDVMMSFEIDQCPSLSRLERHASYLEELIRSKTDELRRVKERAEQLKKAAELPVLKKCLREGCTNMTQHGGMCSRHEIDYGSCTVEGCNNVADGPDCICTGHRLYRPGTYKKVCAREGCNNRAKAGGYCMRHNENKPGYWYCNVEGCTRKSQVGGVCVKHGAVMPKCSVEGCTKDAKKGGLCAGHRTNRGIGRPRSSSKRCEQVPDLPEPLEETTIEPI